MGFKYQNSSAICEVSNPTERALICVFACFADNKGRCFPSIAKLQELLKVSNKTVIETIKSLEKKGLIKKRKRHHKSTEYEILLPGFVDMEGKPVEMKNLHFGDRVNMKDLHNETLCQSVDQGKVKVKDLHTNRSVNRSDLKHTSLTLLEGCGEVVEQEEKPKPKKPKSITARREGIDYEAIAEYWNVNAKQNGLAKIMCMNSDRIKAVNKALDYPALKDKTTKGIKYLIWAFFQCASGWWFADDTKHNARLDTIFNNKNIEKWIDYVDQHSETEQPENGDLF